MSIHRIQHFGHCLCKIRPYKRRQMNHAISRDWSFILPEGNHTLWQKYINQPFTVVPIKKNEIHF